jgi:hypothetical protein
LAGTALPGNAGSGLRPLYDDAMFLAVVCGQPGRTEEVSLMRRSCGLALALFLIADLVVVDRIDQVSMVDRSQISGPR